MLTLVGTSGAERAPALVSFWRAFGVHGRLLVCVPLLLLADRLCTPRLFRIFNNFEREDIVVDRARFEAERDGVLRLFDSRLALIPLVLLAYAASAVVVLSFPTGALPLWHRVPGDEGPVPYSIAGWWHVAVALPVVLLLILRWLWRIALWARLLGRVAKMELRLVASHPDGAAGLGFLGSTLRAWAPLVTALSALSASRTAQVVVNRGMLPSQQLYADIALAAILVLTFAAPLIVFTPVLVSTRRRMAPAYAALALYVGRAFEARWIDAHATRGEEGDPLRLQDFSATTDLYSVVDNARALSWMPMGRKDVITVVLAVLAPFLPVVLLTVPINVILKELRSLLF
jgi:hypothetical protein